MSDLEYEELADVNLRQAPEFKTFQDRDAEHVLEEGSGFEPGNNKVLVLPDAVPQYSQGGIAIPHEVVEKEEYAQIFGTLIAVGPDAWKDRKTPVASPGDRVMIAKFTGQVFTGADGKRYRVIHDLDIIGKVTKTGVHR